MNMDYQAIIASRRREAYAKAATCRQQAHQLYPELREIDREIALTQDQIDRDPNVKPEARDDLKALNQMHRARRDKILERIGLAADYDQPQFSCPRCQDTGRLSDNRFCTCYRALWTQDTKIPAEEVFIQDASFAGFSADLVPDESLSPNLGQGLQVSDQPSPRMLRMLTCIALKKRIAPTEKIEKPFDFVTGRTGTGKTYLAGAQVHALRQQGYRPTLYVRANTLFGDLLQLEHLLRTYGPDPVEIDRLRKRKDLYYQVPSLVVDDLGVETHEAERVIPLFLELLEYRGSNLKHYDLYLSPWRLPEFRTRYDERIYNKLQQLCVVLPLPDHPVHRPNESEESGHGQR